MELDDALRALGRIPKRNETIKLTVAVYQPGSIGRTPVVAVESISEGIDWDRNTVLIQPEEPLTRLSSEDLEAITFGQGTPCE